ncbi:MAG: TonB-dependent receptor, partial [Muribaculaceae bacterium]|nr:TonB-dependent receptor [Muribaculaceae bacterium]
MAKNHHLALLIACVAFTHNAMSQSRLDSIQQLPEVVVKAQSYKEVIPAQTLKGIELEALRSHSVADALRYFSGVQLKDYGGVGGIKTVNIRSMGTNHMGVYYNGIELGNAQNGQVDLGKYSLENIEAVSLYNGQKSDIFQSAREFGSAGSIYLTTRYPKFKNGENCHLRAGLKVGSFDVFNPSITFDYKVSSTVSLSFNSEWMNASGKYKFRYRRVTPSGELAYDTTAVRQNGDIDAMRLEGGLHGFIPNGKWKVYLYHYSSERGIPGAIVNNVWRRGERLWDRNSFAQGMFEYDINRKLSTKVNAKYAFDYTRYVNNDDKLIHVDNIYKQREAYLSWANKYSIFSNWDVSAAYDFQWNGLSEYMNVDRTTHWLSLATALSLGDCFKLQASGLMTYVNEEQRDRDSAPDKFKFTPGVFLSYKPFSRHNFVARAFYKQSYRMPTFNDLYYTDIGNAYLKPETATQYNLGILYDIERNYHWFKFFKIGADIYYNDIDDKIVAYPKGQQFRWTMLNLGKVEIKGIDAQIGTTFGLPYT